MRLADILKKSHKPSSQQADKNAPQAVIPKIQQEEQTANLPIKEENIIIKTVKEDQVTSIPKKIEADKTPLKEQITPETEVIAQKEIPKIKEKNQEAEAIASAKTAEEVYTKAIIEIKNIVSCIEKKLPLPEKIECVKELTDLIISGNNEIIVLADKATPDIYFYGHCVNTCIFSLVLGQTFGLDKDRMIKLGYCALFHDIGIIKVFNIVLKKDKLTNSEYLFVRKHPLYGQEFIKNMHFLSEDIKIIVIQVMNQVNERKNKNLSIQQNTNDIHEFTRIIGITAKYEALTHPRTYRDRIIPHIALKTMINSPSYSFDKEIIKTFINKISLYPPGSYVRLNTEEIAKIISTNSGLPTRPVIKIIISASQERYSERKIINLASSPMIFIKEPVDETKLNISDNRLLIELKAIRWWVKGI